MDKTKTCLVIAMTLAGAAVGCSSDEPSSEAEYAQPAASQGQEATPPEPIAPPMQNAPAPVAPAEQQPLSAAPPSTAPMEQPDTAGESLRDAQIVKITDLVNTGEIEQAQLARTKSTNPKVKKFAAMMITQHQKAKQDGAKLSKTANLTPEQSPTAGDLETKSAQTLATLKSSDAASFDAAYMSAQVEQHQEVLGMLTTKLIPSASDAKLKAALEDTRTMVQRHLTEAQQLSQSLSD